MQSVHVDCIEINVPHLFKRTGEPYEIPEWLFKMDRIKIFRTEDFGAITKIAPTLIRHFGESQTLVWSCDDDMKYPPHLLGDLVKHHDPSSPAILSITGGKFHRWSGNINYFNEQRHEIDLLEGYSSVLYPAWFIKDDFDEYVKTTSEDSLCRASDDIILSNYFAKRRVPIHRIPLEKHVDFFTFGGSVSLTYGDESTALHNQFPDQHSSKYVKVMSWLEDRGMLYMKTSETKKGGHLEFILLAILLGILCFFIVYYLGGGTIKASMT